MAHREGEKQVSFYIDEEEKEQFNTLCKTMNVSVGVAMRNFIHRANQEQNLGFDLIVANPPHTPVRASGKAVDDGVVKNVLKRLDSLERSIPKFDIEELQRMKKEILNGEFGSMRYRMGVIESQVQELGGSIAWNSGPKKD